MSLPVQQMLWRIVQGDEAAAAWLYETFAGRLRRRLGMRYRGLDADELVQEAFVSYLRNDAALIRRAIDRLPEGEGQEARLERYLWDLACGLATNQRRSASHRRVVQLGPVERRAEESGPEEESVARDLLVRLDACLRGRGDRVYLYFKLRFVDGLQPREIATSTGWSMKATYKLRQALNEAVAACSEELGIE